MTPAQCRAARALISMTQPQLAQAASVGLSTVVDFEKERRSVSTSTIEDLRTALESLKIIFIPANGDGPGVRLKKE